MPLPVVHRMLGNGNCDNAASRVGRSRPFTATPVMRANAQLLMVIHHIQRRLAPRGGRRGISPERRKIRIRSRHAREPLGHAAVASALHPRRGNATGQLIAVRGKKLEKLDHIGRVVQVGFGLGGFATDGSRDHMRGLRVVCVANWKVSSSTLAEGPGGAGSIDLV
eukprot:scaffold1900_cov32-Tisochrysis_lutea.AAC.1